MIYEQQPIYGIPLRLFHCNPLISASFEGHFEIVKLLLSQPGIEINCQTISTLTNHE